MTLAIKYGTKFIAIEILQYSLEFTSTVQSPILKMLYRTIENL